MEKKVQKKGNQGKKVRKAASRAKKVRKDSSAPALRLKGELTIERTGELKEALEGALEKTGRADIDVRDVTAVDIPCMQLFFSANRSARRKKKNIVLLGASDALRDMIAAYGFKLDRAEDEAAGAACYHLS